MSYSYTLPIRPAQLVLPFAERDRNWNEKCGREFLPNKKMHDVFWDLYEVYFDCDTYIEPNGQLRLQGI